MNYKMLILPLHLHGVSHKIQLVSHKIQLMSHQLQVSLTDSVADKDISAGCYEVPYLFNPS